MAVPQLNPPKYCPHRDMASEQVRVGIDYLSWQVGVLLSRSRLSQQVREYIGVDRELAINKVNIQTKANEMALQLIGIEFADCKARNKLGCSVECTLFSPRIQNTDTLENSQEPIQTQLQESDLSNDPLIK